ncbi:MAG: hypothetical protein V1844_12890 [Pseudomonadota bacterium]
MGFFRKAILLEAGAAILFFGALATRLELDRSGALALSELQALGYRTPTVSEPVRVYPARTGAAFTSAHAGGWHPGVISLREDPAGASGPEIYLRHELMHEAGHRTCAGRLPLWAEEAAAIGFSGELKSQPVSEPPTESELDHLREKVRIGAGLDGAGYGALSKLVSSHGWPSEPCGVSREIEKLLRDPAGSGFSYILISLLSGERLDARGDLKTRYPPGSLLKIPYAASLTEAENAAVGEELCASDTVKLLGRKHAFSPEKFRFLTSAVKDAPLAESFAGQEAGGWDAHFWRQFVGERSPEGSFPFEANLRELALVLRASLLLKPERFYGLSKNGFTPGSTLYPEPEKHKAILKRLRALCKTGTTSDARGNPLTGHLMVAWPQEDPLFLAVFRGNGNNGASNIRRASEVLQAWSSRYTPLYGQVRVRLLMLTPRASWEIQDVCPSAERPESGGRSTRFSTCGRFKIVSSARGSRSERWVSGLLQSDPDGNAVILQTDPETYSDAVLASEAQDLRGEAQKALRAAIVWNGVHGGHRHPDTQSLCDTTHCMVFQGQDKDGPGKPPGKTDIALLNLLDEIAAQKKWDWLSFSEGGAGGWERQIPFRELKALVDESAILDLRRERTRSGEIVVHLMYPEAEERVPCEVFRARLKLPSCPESIQSDAANSTWIFQGIGKGHGQGLSVDNARNLAGSGTSAAAILRDAYK